MAVNPSTESPAARPAILVTGARGFLGQPLVTRLEDSGYRVYGSYHPALDPSPPENPRFLPLDITDDSSVRGMLQRLHEIGVERLASVVHLAAYYDFSGEPSPLYQKVTVQGTQRLLQALRDFGENRVEQFVFSSTMLVHAPVEPGESITEDTPLQAKWAYPASKIQTEQVIHQERGQIPTVLLRIAGVYESAGHSIPLTHQMQRIYERQITGKLFPGNPFHGQAFVHRDDVVDAILRTVERRNQLPSEIAILIGEDEVISYDELQQTFGRLLHDGEPWETVTIPAPVAEAGAWAQEHLPGADSFIKPFMIQLADDHYALDISRARDLLAWTPQHHLRDALPQMAEALKSDPAMFYQENNLGDRAAGELPAKES